MTANSPGRLLKNLLLGDGEQWRFNVEPQGRAVYPGRRIRSRLLLPGLQRDLPNLAPSLCERARPMAYPSTAATTERCRLDRPALRGV